MTGNTSLAVFKALGDNTRYAIYLELARAAKPLSTTEISVELNLHVNTVRPHLERMREIGLLDLSVDVSGGVGRPQHRYGLAADAPSLGLEPPAFPVAASVLLRAASGAGLSGDDLVEAGREQGRTDFAQRVGQLAADGDVADALMQRLADLGFDPGMYDGPRCQTIAFGHCPFQDLAETSPDLVCGMHRGLIEGFVDAAGSSIGEFRGLTDPNPCQVDLPASAKT